ncbi:MAG: type restriction enzyme, SfiI family [Dehalococcoidia bacterium]|nr:type restriction enzyme, SfiI family [Dehalococcoidia bacterium]
MTLDPSTLEHNHDLLEAIEKATLRLVVHAVSDFRHDIVTIFAQEADMVADIGEDLTREALDRVGTSIIPVRLCRARRLSYEGSKTSSYV